MKKDIVQCLLIGILILSACSPNTTPVEPSLVPSDTPSPSKTPTPTVQPTFTIPEMVDAYLSGDIEYPSDLTAEQESTFLDILSESETSLPYEQQKQLIEDRFVLGAKAWEALVNAEGNLDYYDGTWKTLEAMRNVNNEIIPWGESYEMATDKGQNGILINIMAGNQEFMDSWNQAFTAANKKVEGNNIGSTNADILFVQFFPNPNSLTKERESRQIYHYDMDGQIVVKNEKGKILVIDINTFLSIWSVVHVFVESEKFFSYDLIKLYENKAIENCFLGIQNQNMLNFALGGLVQYADEPNEKAFIDKVMSSSMENFQQKLGSNPNLIGEDLYHIAWLIYP